MTEHALPVSLSIPAFSVDSIFGSGEACDPMECCNGMCKRGLCPVDQAMRPPWLRVVFVVASKVLPW